MVCFLGGIFYSCKIAKRPSVDASTAHQTREKGSEPQARRLALLEGYAAERRCTLK